MIMMTPRIFAISALAASILAIPPNVFAEPIANNSSLADNGTASEVVIRDDMWQNPALINVAPKQVSVNSNNSGGLVTNLLGQRLGAHARPGQADLFWGMGLSSGMVGTRLGVELDNSSDLPSPNFLGEPLYTSSPYDNGTDLTSVDIQEFDEYDNFRNLELDLGAVLMDGGLSLVGRVGSTNDTSGTAQKGSVTNNFGAGDGGTSTGKQYNEIDELNETAASGLNLGLEGQFYLSEISYILGSFRYGASTVETTNRNNSRTTSRNASNNITSDVGVFDETVNTEENSGLSAGLGIGLIERTEQITMRIEQMAFLTSVSRSGEDKVTDDRFIDYQDNANNVINPNGVNATSEDSELIINLPLRATIEGAVSETWTWRGGLEADLMQFFTEDDEATAYKVNAAGDAFIEDFTVTSADSSTLNVPDGVNTIFGLAYEPIDNLTLDMVFNQAFLTSGFFNNGLATEFTLTYSF